VWSIGLTDNPPAFIVVDRNLTVTGVQFGFDPNTGDEDLRKLVADALGTGDAHPNGEGFCE